jgi:hypothetical protein
MLRTIRYYWIAARGYRFTPWKSPYIQWRLETLPGKEAANLNALKFFRISWQHRNQLQRFVDWAAQRRRIQRRHA